MNWRLPRALAAADGTAGPAQGSPLPLLFDPGLIEEVVLRTLGGQPAERGFRRARNRLYETTLEERETVFAQFHRQWFAQLQLDAPFITALAELSILAQTCHRCVVARAHDPRDEGGDLLVATEADGETVRTVALRLCASSFDPRAALLAFLRIELQHIADMVDPAFGYQPTLPAVDGGPSYEHLLRQRYRVVWDVSVAGRLVRRGKLDGAVRDEVRRRFAASFPMLGDQIDAAFARFFDAEAVTHADVLALAAVRPGLEYPGGLTPGGRCPLCRFPTYAPTPEPRSLPPAVVARIQADFASWQPADGLCMQCADLYRARATDA